MIYYIAAHILCGLVAVWLSGVCDKLCGDPGATSPVLAFFIAGPFGLLFSLIGYCILATPENMWVLSTIYKKGRGK